MWIATAAEMREIELLSEAEHGLTPEILMENAGKAVFQIAKEMAGDSRQLNVVCGKGNNGGDGFVVARLAAESGWEVRCATAVPEKELGELCKKQMESARRAGCLIGFEMEGFDTSLRILGDPNVLVIDAILGTGSVGAPKGFAERAVRDMNECKRVLAIDVPSGVDADTGQAQGLAVKATRTVCLGAPKPYLFSGEGAALCGEWSVDPIGITLGKPTGAKLVELEDVRLAPREMLANKGDNGHVLIVAGSRQYRGAATLATLGALKAGAGLVTVAAIEPVVEAVAAQVPEAIFIVLPEYNGAIASDAALTLKMQMGKVTSAVFGPGLTQSESVRAFLEDLWADWWIPSVIDADALNLVAAGLKLPNSLNILTPHPGEAARLLGTDVATIQSDRFRSARALQEAYGWPTILKGAYSVAAIADTPLLVNPTGNPGMATGGMGDVLAGVLATLNQPQANPAATCATAMYWHGLAGDLAAKEIGEIGFSASDLAQFLPRARSILTK